MLINDERWSGLTKAQKVALVDHELCHAVQKVSKDGESGYGMRNHDIEEFSEIVQRHGLWTQGLETFAAAMGEQMPFDFGTKEDGPIIDPEGPRQIEHRPLGIEGGPLGIDYKDGEGLDDPEEPEPEEPEVT